MDASEKLLFLVVNQKRFVFVQKSIILFIQETINIEISVLQNAMAIKIQKLQYYFHRRRLKQEY